MSIVVIDTETTGTGAWSRVVELGAVALSADGHTLGMFESLMRPGILDERAEPALRRSGFTLADIEAAPPTADVRDLFTTWLENYGVTEAWAFNRYFDQSMLERSDIYLPWKGCVMQLCRKALPHNEKTLSLERYARFFRVPLVRKHRALDDAKAAAALFCRLRG